MSAGCLSTTWLSKEEPEYEVTVVETCTYRFKVKAGFEREAKLDGEVYYLESDDMTKHLVGVDERDITAEAVQ